AHAVLQALVGPELPQDVVLQHAGLAADLARAAPLREQVEQRRHGVRDVLLVPRGLAQEVRQLFLLTRPGRLTGASPRLGQARISSGRSAASSFWSHASIASGEAIRISTSATLRPGPFSAATSSQSSAAARMTSRSPSRSGEPSSRRNADTGMTRFASIVPDD